MNIRSLPTRKRDSGYILVTTIMFVLILTVLGSSLLSQTPPENSLVIARQDDQAAFYAAESGRHRTLRVLNDTGVLDQANNPSFWGLAGTSLVNITQLRATQTLHPSEVVIDAGPLQLSGPDASPIHVLSASQFGREVDTVVADYDVLIDPLQDPGKLIRCRHLSLSINDLLIGPIMVGAAEDSVNIVNYTKGPPIIPDSVSVAPWQQLELASWFNTMLSDGYATITGAQIANSSATSPCTLGIGQDTYYASSGLFVPGGLVGEILVHGRVFVLINGALSLSKDLDIIPDTPDAQLIIVTNAAEGTGLDLSKVANAGSMPVIMITNGDVRFKKTGAADNLTVWGRDVFLTKDQTFSYHREIMTPIIWDLINKNLLPPVPGGYTQLKFVRGSWASR